MAKKPIFVLVPGAWHTPDAFKPLTDLLHSRGYETKSVSLATVSSSLSDRKSTDADGTAIEAAVNEELAEGRDVVVVCHSYGGIATGEGLQKFQSNNHSGGGKIKRIVYMCAFALPEGVSLFNAIGNQDMDWFKLNDDRTVVEAGESDRVFYNDLPSSAASTYTSRLLPFTYAAMHYKQTFAPWRHFPSTYILCEQDNAIPIQGQEGMVKGAQEAVSTAFDTVERCEASHSPFLSMPERMADFLVKAAS